MRRQVNTFLQNRNVINFVVILAVIGCTFCLMVIWVSFGSKAHSANIGIMPIGEMKKNNSKAKFFGLQVKKNGGNFLAKYISSLFCWS